MNYLLSDRELEIQIQIADFVVKTQQQIAKDFARSGIILDPEFLEKEYELEVILRIIQLHLADLMKKNERDLLQLMYQIDLPQSIFLDTLGHDDAIQTLSLLILKREAYKVFLRNKFST